MSEIKISIAGEAHLHFAEEICSMMEQAAQQRGTGIAKRSTLYVTAKMMEGKAIIAIADNKPVGFCYIETWGHGKYVANSGLIVHPDYRKTGLAKNIKAEAFNLSRTKFPEAKIFGITTSMAVMKINSDLGYKPVTFSELTTDEDFWKGCQSCRNYDILTRTGRSHCLCTGMMFDPNQKPKHETQKVTKEERWEKFKRFIKFEGLREGADRLRQKIKNKSNNFKSNNKSWLSKISLF